MHPRFFVSINLASGSGAGSAIGAGTGSGSAIGAGAGSGSRVLKQFLVHPATGKGAGTGTGSGSGIGSGSGEVGKAKGSLPSDMIPLQGAPIWSRRELSEPLCAAQSATFARLIPKEFAIAALREDLTEPVHAMSSSI